MNTSYLAPRHIALAGALFAMASLPAAALSMDELDANADGAVSYGEMLVVVPSMTEVVFVAMDTNGDAMIDADELAAAQEAGTLPATDG